MEPISDIFQFEDVMQRVRDLADNLPDTQEYLVELLNLLIADALLELTGPKFDGAKRIGDLDDADGILHLLSDYPATVPEGGFWRVAFLHAEEEAAARLLLTLYQARDGVLLFGEGVSGEMMQEIEQRGGKLIAWRLHGPAFEHDQRRKKESVSQSKKASKNRKRTASGEPVTSEKVQAFAAKWQAINPGRKKGLLKAIWAEFGMTSKTAHIYLKKIKIVE